MLQQLLQGTEFSSYSVAHEGHLILHSDTLACASNLRYLNLDDHQVRQAQLSCLAIAFKGLFSCSTRVQELLAPGALWHLYTFPCECLLFLPPFFLPGKEC